MSTPPSARPPPPPPPPQQTPYAILTAHLDIHASQILEIEILPSSLPLPPTTSSPFLTDGLSLGLPKRTLTEVFLSARRLFHSPNATPPDRHQATRALLLFDPEHLTAANFRKQRLLDLRCVADECNGHGELLHALTQELAFLSSLLTSPLNRHTKSPTLWYHRYWVVRTFAADFIHPGARTGAGGFQSDSNAEPAGGIRCLWLSELAVIMRAGDRHPRNYYAWNYARRLFRFLSSEVSRDVAMGPSITTAETTERIQHWCFQHPRDISGWTVLAFLLEQHPRGQGLSEKDDEDMNRLRRKVAVETEGWVRKFAWEGESVVWFLRTMGMDAGRTGKAQGVG